MKSSGFSAFKSIVPACHLLGLVLLHACSSPSPDTNAPLSELEKRNPENALRGIEVAEGLQVTLVAAEPMLQNPTNIDVDEKGRIWVTEAYNYRPSINENPTTDRGDRIMILEDNDGDGRADTAKVFYQGPDLNAPLGIAVLGKRVIVSQSPYVWNFYDDNGDDVADRKEVMFQGIEGEQHDHGVHAFSFGPDGKLYFNFGNNGKTLKDKNGITVLDQDGDEIGPDKYKQGMVFRCDPDGSNVECLGHNFRNPYEVAVDSYGSLWQSDNDDDGNKGTRINYVMPYGNYGYTNEMNGAGWRSFRANMEDSVPLRHWHQNDPGSIPNLLQTGAGSPTGLLVYEGNLLPKKFQGQLIHCDAGPNVVRAYATKKDGAGYTAEINNILNGRVDQWFRPADVCVAPDGSLIVADWYDPGVGGHQAGDQVKGRIYRVAPSSASKYTIPAYSYETIPGSIAALHNPNLAVRHHAFNALKGFGMQAVDALEKMWDADPDPRMQARAFWLLVRINGAKNDAYVAQAIKSNHPELRNLAIRATLQRKGDIMPVLRQLKNDPDPMVRRECAVALHHQNAAEAAAIWTALALQHDGRDRWYLEALGIGADRQWDRFFEHYLSIFGNPTKNLSGRDLVWRARTERSLPYLAALAADTRLNHHERLRYLRAFDFNKGHVATTYLLKMIEKNPSDTAFNKFIFYAMEGPALERSPVAREAMQKVLTALYGSQGYIDLVAKYGLKSESKNLLELCIREKDNDLGKNAVQKIWAFGEIGLFQQVLKDPDTSRSNALVVALSRAGNKESVDLLQQILLSAHHPKDLRKFAASRLGKTGEGEKRVISLLENRKVPKAFLADLVSSVSGSWRQSVKEKAASFLPKNQSIAAVKIPTLEEINLLKSDKTKGKAVFAVFCAGCHKVNTEGYDFGPALGEIGSKYGRDGLLKAILYPSEGISFGYEGWLVKTNDGSETAGIISSRTESEIELRLPGGSVQKISADNLRSLRMMKTSMMPEGLHTGMKTQELADLLAYLEGLKRN